MKKLSVLVFCLLSVSAQAGLTDVCFFAVARVAGGNAPIRIAGAGGSVPTREATWRGVKMQFLTGRFLTGKKTNLNDPEVAADYYDYLAEHPYIHSPRRGNKWDSQAFKNILKNTAKALRQESQRKALLSAEQKILEENKRSEISKNPQLFQARQALAKSAAEGYHSLIQAIEILKRHETELTPEEKEIVENHTYFLLNTPFPPAGIAKLPSGEKEKFEEVMKIVLAEKNENALAIASAKYILGEGIELRSPTERAQILETLKEEVFPALILEMNPARLIQNPQLFSHSRRFYIEKSEGLIKAPRFAIRSLDNSSSTTYQKMPNGDIRIEGYRAKVGEVAEPFGFTLKRGKKLVEDSPEELSKCASCHRGLMGRIDFKASAMRDSRNLGKQTAHSLGEEFELPDRIEQMRTIKSETQEDQRLKEWTESVRLGEIP